MQEEQAQQLLQQEEQQFKNTGTPADDLLVVVLDFTADFSCSNGTFTVTFPAPASGTPAGSDALLSITS